MSDNLVTNIISDQINVSITQTSPTITAAIKDSNFNVMLESNNVEFVTQFINGNEFITNIESDSGIKLNTWLDYVTGYLQAPTLIYDGLEYQVFQYEYEILPTLYRKISKTSLDDEFYDTYENGVLSNLIVKKKL